MFDCGNRGAWWNWKRPGVMKLLSIWNECWNSVYVLLPICASVYAVRSSLWVELRFWEGMRVRDGTLQSLLQALVWLGQSFIWILCIPLLEKQGGEEVWDLPHTELLSRYERCFSPSVYLDFLLIHLHAEIGLRSRPTAEVHQRRMLHTRARRQSQLVVLFWREFME